MRSPMIMNIAWDPLRTNPDLPGGEAILSRSDLICRWAARSVWALKSQVSSHPILQIVTDFSRMLHVSFILANFPYHPSLFQFRSRIPAYIVSPTKIIKHIHDFLNMWHLLKYLSNNFPRHYWLTERRTSRNRFFRRSKKFGLHFTSLDFTITFGKQCWWSLCMVNTVPFRK